MLMGPYKQCKVCRVVKLRRYFSVDNSVLDGLQRRCKECAQARTAISNKSGISWRRQAVKRKEETRKRREALGLPPFVRSKEKVYVRPTKWSV